MGVSGEEWVRACQDIGRWHRKWVAAGSPSIETKYSGWLSFALAFSWRDWYRGARDWLLDAYPTFADGIGRMVRPPEYSETEIRNAQEAIYFGVEAAWLLDQMGHEGIEPRFRQVFEEMCRKQGGKLI